MPSRISLVFFEFCVFRISCISYFSYFVFRIFRISYLSYFVFFVFRIFRISYFCILYLIYNHEVSKKTHPIDTSIRSRILKMLHTNLLIIHIYIFHMWCHTLTFKLVGNIAITIFLLISTFFSIFRMFI